MTEHLEHIASQHEDEIVKNKDYDISGGVISSYVRKCIIDANVYDINVIYNILENYVPGMTTKIEATKICNLAGCNMIIANGLYLNPLNRIEKTDNCTWFISKVSKLHARKKWILSSVSPKGELIIDDGAKKALKSGKSLLAAGIKKVLGKFNKGDHIKILDIKKREFARGLSSFSSDEINKIMGCHSNEIQKILGYISKSQVVHKDDMVEI